KDTQRFNSLEALAVLLPAAEAEEHAGSNGNGHVVIDAISPDTVDDEMLLSLASALKQSLQAWRKQLAQAPDSVEQLRRLRAERMEVETRMVDTRARFQKQKGWRVLEKVVEGAGSTALDTETTRLC